MENLNEGKKKKGAMTYEAALREIDAQSAIVAMEAKIEKLKEMATKKKDKMKMVQEDENLSELIDKRAMSAMMKEIKQIEKMQEKLEKLYEKKNGKKMPEMVDEDEEMNEYGSSTQMIPDKKEDGTYDMSSVGMKEEEIDEAHCTSEEDDLKEKKEEMMENFDLKKYLAENRLLKENKIAQALRDEAKQPDSKVGAAIFNKYAKKIESAPKEDYRKILTSMERELIDKHPDTFDGDDDIVASFMAAK